MTKVPCNVVVLILQERCRNGPEIGECLRVDRKVDREEGATFRNCRAKTVHCFQKNVFIIPFFDSIL